MCLPEGGLGNLVALPLQGNARKNGNSVFVNEYFEPFPDQWEYLLNVGKLSASALEDGRSPIILTSRTAHIEILANLLKPHCPNVITLVGSESTKEKRQKMEYLQSIPSTEPLVIVATGKYVGEGFDYARLDTLFLIWYGCVNILGYHSAEDNLIRFKNPEIATTLLESISNKLS